MQSQNPPIGQVGDHSANPSAPPQLHPPSPQDVNPRTPPPSYASLGLPPGPYYTIPTTPSRGFGPTPLTVPPPNQTMVLSVPLLPYAYYDAPGTADARARWRFAESFLWAVGVWVLCGVVIVLEIIGEGGR